MAEPRLHLALEAQLNQVEALMQKVSSALLTGEPLALEGATTALRQGMLELASLMRTPAGAGQHAGAALRGRFERISLLLTQQRENLIRRSVVVDRALGVVLPQAQTGATYSGGVKAGAYRGGAARIYAAVAI